MKLGKDAPKDKPAEPSVLELSTLSKINPKVLDEKISSKKMADSKLQKK